MHGMTVAPAHNAVKLNICHLCVLVVASSRWMTAAHSLECAQSARTLLRSKGSWACTDPHQPYTLCMLVPRQEACQEIHLQVLLLSGELAPNLQMYLLTCLLPWYKHTEVYGWCGSESAQDPLLCLQKFFLNTQYNMRAYFTRRCWCDMLHTMWCRKPTWTSPTLIYPIL